MWLRKFALLGSILTALAGCDLPSPNTAAPDDTSAAAQIAQSDSFGAIVSRLAPVVQDTCEAADIARNCKIRLYVAETPDQDINAFQSVDRLGRPFVVITPQLIEAAQSADEIALVLAHEAAHHILGHLDQQQEAAIFGANLLGNAAEAKGATAPEIREAREIGAFVGTRAFSQEFELEADALGALMLQEAGFDAINGASFYQRIPDPGNHALNTHPSNGQRAAMVRKALRTGALPSS